MIAYNTGEVYDKGVLLGRISLSIDGEWQFFPKTRTKPSVSSTSRSVVEISLGCRSEWSTKEIGK